jgi:hypothetical protein
VTKPTLYHCFPRPKLVRREADDMVVRIPHSTNDSVGLDILEAIFNYGLVCTSEPLRVKTDPLRVLAEGRASELHTISEQTRACFTLSAFEDLSVPHASGYFRKDGQDVLMPASHFDLFGGFGIAIDPIVGRRLGIMPAMYYYRIEGVDEGGPEEMLRRLHEAKQTLLALHLIEEKSGKVRIPWIHTAISSERATSNDLGLTVDDKRVETIIRELGSDKAAAILPLFDVDRRSSWQIIDKINYLLGLFQNTDSSFEHSPLAFYEQREWRLPYNSQSNLGWYSLGNHPKIRDPQKSENILAAEIVLKTVERIKGRSLTNSERDSTWVLFEVDALPFASNIEEIVCPNYMADRVERLVRREIHRGKINRGVKISHSQA